MVVSGEKALLVGALLQDILHGLYTQIIRQTGRQIYVEMFLERLEFLGIGGENVHSDK